jgi:predicted permease
MNAQTIEIINRVSPILLLLLLGYATRRTGFLTDELVAGLRKIVVNLALPAVLFLSFTVVELQASFLILSLVIFLLCVVLYGIGKWLQPRVAADHEYFPFLMTGFEFGMLGTSLFGSAYGIGNLGYIAVIGLGHEIFIWFVFLPLLLMKRDAVNKPGELLGSFFKSPVIIAILLGIGLNLAGLGESLADGAMTGGIITTLEYLANLTVPLILLTVGYGIKLNRTGIGSAVRVVAIRLAILIPLALVLNQVLISGLLQLGKPYQVAFFTLLILPPPFIIPLFMRKDMPDEERYVNNVLMLYTLATIAIFTVYFVINPSL